MIKQLFKVSSVSRSSVAWQGRVSEDVANDLCLSRVRTGVAAMGKDCNYQLDIMKLGRKIYF
jgi:hypothetical protein